jgi:sigma-B regulation protein RsbU (phosphoserine phosphatase)
MNRLPPRVEIIFPSSPEYLALVRAAVRTLCEKCEFTEVECSRTVLAVVEAVTNIIRHAYHGDPGQEIVLRARDLGDGLELEFLDRGDSVPPATISSRDLAEVEPGGLGVHMMKSCMDEVSYEGRPGGGSRLVLRKFRGSSGPCAGKGGAEG